MKMINICLLAIVLALPIKISATPAQELYNALVPVQNNIRILNGHLKAIAGTTITESSSDSSKYSTAPNNYCSQQLKFLHTTQETVRNDSIFLKKYACDLITAQQKAYAIAQTIVTNWKYPNYFNIQKPGLEPLDAPKLVPVTVNLANGKSTTLYYPVIPNWSYCNWPNDPNDPRQQLCLQGESPYPPTGVSAQIDYIQDLVKV